MLSRLLLRGVLLLMSKIEFTRKEKEVIVHQIILYFDRELSQEIGQFDAEFLLDFFSEKIGPSYYNKGLSDARSVLEGKLEDIDAAIYEIEKPVGFG